MIGKLKGLIDSYGEDYVILDVQGVGYQVHCSARTLQALPQPAQVSDRKVVLLRRVAAQPVMAPQPSGPVRILSGCGYGLS